MQSRNKKVEECYQAENNALCCLIHGQQMPAFSDLLQVKMDFFPGQGKKSTSIIYVPAEV